MIAHQLVSPASALETRHLPDPRPARGEVVIDVHAAGVCRSDLHYASGVLQADQLPRTLGHEISGTVAAIGEGVTTVAPGDRVAVHYLVACGSCDGCRRGEQFCRQGQMIGKDRDGGFAEQVVVPERNAIRIPGDVPFETAAIMMCSTATSLHALRVSEAAEGERIVVLGFGGLGVSLLLLCRALGLRIPVVVEARPAKRERAIELGAKAVDPEGDEFERLMSAEPPDVVFDFVGQPELSSRALRSLAPRGRLVLIALSRKGFDFDPYRDVLCGERRILGCSDHTREEAAELLDLAASGRLDLELATSARVPFTAEAAQAAISALREGTDAFRSVLVRR